MADPLATNLIFPPPTANVGLSWGNTKSPYSRGLAKETVSGHDQRASFWSTPKWKYAYNFNVIQPEEPVNQLRAVVAFFAAMRSTYKSFLIVDTEDNSMAQQGIGVGDDSTTTFQIVRNYGGSVVNDAVFPVYDIDESSLALYLDDGGPGDPTLIPGTNYTYAGNGLITDLKPDGSNPTPTGNVILCTCDFYQRVRFEEEEMEVEEFTIELWRAQGVRLISVRGESHLAS